MSQPLKKPILIQDVNLLWYLAALVPILALVYFSFNGTLPQTFGLIAIFLFVFWLSSFIFAVVGKLTKKKKPELRQ
jgi:hypothetical protein